VLIFGIDTFGGIRHHKINSEILRFEPLLMNNENMHNNMYILGHMRSQKKLVTKMTSVGMAREKIS